MWGRTLKRALYSYPLGGRPAPGAGGKAEMHVIPVPLTLLTAVGSMRVTVPPDLRGADARHATLLMLRVRTPSYVYPNTWV